MFPGDSAGEKAFNIFRGRCISSSLRTPIVPEKIRKEDFPVDSLLSCRPLCRSDHFIQNDSISLDEGVADVQSGCGVVVVCDEPMVAISSSSRHSGLLYFEIFLFKPRGSSLLLGAWY